jgi:hypothetical protein
LDEIDYAKPELLIAVLPLALQKHVAVVGASSPDSKKSFMKDQMQLIDNDTGRPIWSTVLLVEICEECKLTDEPWKCQHMLHNLSFNKSNKRRAILSEIFKHSGPEVLQEFFGTIVDKKNDPFYKVHVDNFAKRRKINKTDIVAFPKCLYIGMDPTGAGKSDLGICAIGQTLIKENHIQRPIDLVSLLFSLLRLLI